MENNFLNIRDLEIIMKVWKGQFSHKDATQVEQSIETMEKLESLLQNKKKEMLK